MWQVIRSNITHDLKSNNEKYPRTKVFITGISLGGALSLVSWVDLRLILKDF